MKPSGQDLAIPSLPPNLVLPCENISELTQLGAMENYFWAIDTVEKYNRCAIMKDAVTAAYLALTEQKNVKRNNK